MPESKKPRRSYRGSRAAVDDTARLKMISDARQAWRESPEGQARRKSIVATRQAASPPVPAVAQRDYYGANNQGSAAAQADRGLLHPGSPKKPTSFSGTRAGKITSGVLIGGGLASTGYLVHRSRTAAKETMARSGRQKTMASKSLINPFEQVVVFGKAYDVSFFPQSSVRVRALVPTGAHVGHGNQLGHYRGKNTSSRTNELRHYTGSGKGLRQGPFGVHKAAWPGYPVMTRGEKMMTSALIGRGQGTRVATKRGHRLRNPGRHRAVNSNIPAGPSVGSRF